MAWLYLASPHAINNHSPELLIPNCTRNQARTPNFPWCLYHWSPTVISFRSGQTNEKEHIQAEKVRAAMDTTRDTSRVTKWQATTTSTVSGAVPVIWHHSYNYHHHTEAHRQQTSCDFSVHIIGASLSKPYASVTALHMHVCMLAWTDHLS